METQTTTQNTEQLTVSKAHNLVSQKEKELQQYDSKTLKALIQQVKKKTIKKYGQYQGVFSPSSPQNPTEKDLDRLAQKVAAENILETRGEL